MNIMTWAQSVSTLSILLPILDTLTFRNSSKSLQVCLQESQKKGGLQVVYKWWKSVNIRVSAYVTIPTQ